MKKEGKGNTFSVKISTRAELHLYTLNLEKKIPNAVFRTLLFY